jgi:hypothetical protein
MAQAPGTDPNAPSTSSTPARRLLLPIALALSIGVAATCRGEDHHAARTEEHAASDRHGRPIDRHVALEARAGA